MLLSWLTESFESNTLAWLTLSTVIGSVLGASITLIFDEVIRPRFAMRREARKVYRKYRFPLINATTSLERQINTIVRSRGQAWLTAEYYKLSTFYKFGAFLFWIRRIELDVGVLDMASSKRSKEFIRKMYGPFAGLCSIRRYFKGQPFAGESALPRDVARAIGEEMLDSNSDHSSLMGFADFVRKYGSDAQFRNWFVSLDEMLEDMATDARPIRVERLIITGAHLKQLLIFLDPKRTFSSHRVYNLRLLTREELWEELPKSGINRPEPRPDERAISH